MRCKIAERYISLKLDGELSAKHDRALMQHLDRCSLCQKIMKDHQGILKAMQQMPDPGFPPYLHHRIMSSLPKSAPKAAYRAFRLSLAATALSVLISIALGTMVGIKGYESYGLYAETTGESMLLSFGENSIVELAFDE